LRRVAEQDLDHVVEQVPGVAAAGGREIGRAVAFEVGHDAVPRAQGQRHTLQQHETAGLRSIVAQRLQRTGRTEVGAGTAAEYEVVVSITVEVDGGQTGRQRLAGQPHRCGEGARADRVVHRSPDRIAGHESEVAPAVAVEVGRDQRGGDTRGDRDRRAEAARRRLPPRLYVS
jgi:hypothetical protein